MKSILCLMIVNRFLISKSDYRKEFSKGIKWDLIYRHYVSE